MTSTRVGVQFGAIGLNYCILGSAGMLVQQEKKIDSVYQRGLDE